MIILITGATHTGKTKAAQYLLEKTHIPYMSQDHLKMGLIRSRYTELTPCDDDKMTDYLWPVTREIVKTAIENKQNLIIEGCYMPFNWRNDFEKQYLDEIEYICICFSDEYIDKNFDAIKANSCCIESRLDDDYCTKELLKKENRHFAEGCKSTGEKLLLVDEQYDIIECYLEEIIKK